MLSKYIHYEKVYYYIVALLAFILPLSRAGISVLFALLFLLWIMEGDFQRKYKQIISNKVLVTLAIFLCFLLISFLWTSNTQRGLEEISKTTLLLVVFVIATSIDKEHISKIITFFLAGMFVSEVIAYGVFFEFWQFKHATVQNPSPFMMHIEYSTFMAITSILLLNRILSSRYTIKEKLFFGFFFLTVTGNLFLATGRTGQVALVVGIFVMMFIHFKISFKTVFGSLAIIGIIYSMAYNFSDSFKMRVGHTINDIKQIEQLNFNGSWGIRAAFWITTYNSLLQNPFGSGIGDYKDATKEQLSTNKYPYINGKAFKFMQNSHPHNQYLLILLQVGFIGIILLFLLIYYFFTQKILDDDIKELSILFMTIFCVGFLAEPLLIKHFTLGLFVLFLGLCSVYSIKER